MKTLVNKNNPQIRITAEVETLYDKDRCVKYYYIKDLRLGLLQENWTLVEEEPVDLEKEAVAFCFDNGINITPYQATRIARHFYELRFNARKEE